MLKPLAVKPQLYCWSAPDRETLLADLPTGTEGPCRLALVASDPAELEQKLATASRRLHENPAPRWRHRSGIFFADLDRQPGGDPVAFLFPGQGSEYEGMLQEARQHLPGVQEWLTELEQVWGEPIRWPMSVDLGGMVTTVSGLALAQALTELGVPVHAMAGPSSGENAALMAAGSMQFASRQELFQLLKELFDSGSRQARSGIAPEADFLAVSLEDRAPIHDLLQRFPDQLWLALDNCPRQLILAGLPAAAARAESHLAQSGAFSFRLPFHRAFHTPLYEPVSRSLEQDVYPQLRFSPPLVPVYSCASTEIFPDDPHQISALAASQWASTVRFRETLLRMHRDGVRHFVEVGPGGRLAGFVRDTLRNQPHSAWTTAAEGRSEVVQMLEVAAFLFCEGPAQALPTKACEPAPTPLLAHAQIQGDRLTASLELDPEKHRFLLDHRLGKLPVLPFSFSLELAAEASILLAGGVCVQIENARSSRWLALDEDRLTLGIEAVRIAPDRVQVRLLENHEHPAFACEVTLAPAYPEAPPPLADVPGDPIPVQLSVQAYNASLFHGEGLLSLWRTHAATTGGVEVEVRVPPGHHEPWVLAADTLDAAGHLAAYWILLQGKRRFWLFPNAIERLSLYAPPPPPREILTCRLHLRDESSAHLDWVDGQGRLLFRMHGFHYIWDTYPPQIYDWLHYPARNRRLSEPCEDGRRLLLPPGYLDSTGGIWRRALARRALTSRERASADWPLPAWIAAKEACQAWALERGLKLELDQIELLPDAEGQPWLVGPPIFEALQLTLRPDGVRMEPRPGLVRSS